MHKVKRASYNQQKSTLGSSALIEVLGPNPRRVGIVISANATEDVSFSFDQGSTVSLPGPLHMVKGSTTPLVMCCCDWGTILQQPFFGWATGTITIYVAEILSDEALET